MIAAKSARLASIPAPRAFMPDIRNRHRQFARVPRTKPDRVADERAHAEMVLSAPNKTAAQVGEKAGWLRAMGRVEGAPRAPPVSPKAVNASEEFLGQRDDDAPRASHVAESVLVLVLGHLADEFGVGAQASDSVVNAFDCKHDAPEAQRVRRCDRRFDLDQFWIAKLRQLKPPVPIWGPHHNDVDFDTLEPVDAVHPRALDRHLAFERHAERGEKSDSGCKVVDDDADVVQSFDRHVPSVAEACAAVQAAFS